MRIFKYRFIVYVSGYENQLNYTGEGMVLVNNPGLNEREIKEKILEMNKYPNGKILNIEVEQIPIIE